MLKSNTNVFHKKALQKIACFADDFKSENLDVKYLTDTEKAMIIKQGIVNSLDVWNITTAEKILFSGGVWFLDTFEIINVLADIISETEKERAAYIKKYCDLVEKDESETINKINVFWTNVFYKTITKACKNAFAADVVNVFTMPGRFTGVCEIQISQKWHAFGNIIPFYKNGADVHYSKVEDVTGKYSLDMIGKDVVFIYYNDTLVRIEVREDVRL